MTHSKLPDPTQRFSSRVEQYVRYRPNYPPGIVDHLRQLWALTNAWVVADIGSGTGISTRLFLDAGCEVFAVEPNHEMRLAAESSLAAEPRFHSVAASAESTTLSANSIDLIVAGQAFHWFDVPAARREFQRILHSTGLVALMWNVRRTRGTPFLVEYENLLLAYGTDYAQVRHENVDASVLGAFFAHGGYETTRFDNQQQFDYAGLEGRLLSSSYTPLPDGPGGDAPRYHAMLAELRAIFDRYQENGQVTVTYDTELHVGRLEPD